MLKGEAYFAVAHNDNCPFIVCTEGIDTKVLGTKFKGCSYSKEQRNITLAEGKVEVSNTLSKETTILKPWTEHFIRQRRKATHKRSEYCRIYCLD